MSHTFKKRKTLQILLFSPKYFAEKERESQQQNFAAKLRKSVIFDKRLLTKCENEDTEVYFILINDGVVKQRSIGEAEANFHNPHAFRKVTAFSGKDFAESPKMLRFPFTAITQFLDVCFELATT